MRRILIIQGNPKKDSFCHALQRVYEEGALERGAEVHTLDLAFLQFDPILKTGYSRSQELEPDLIRSQELIRWADHLVFVYPTWWGSVPALLKGFIDRVFLPDFAFRYRKDSVWWDRLLTGRTARLLVTMDTPPWYFRLIYGQPGHRTMKKTVLEFCGIRPVRISSFGAIRKSSEKQRLKWIERTRTLGRHFE